jgi:hypothetical protein
MPNRVNCVLMISVPTGGKAASHDSAWCSATNLVDGCVGKDDAPDSAVSGVRPHDGASHSVAALDAREKVHCGATRLVIQLHPVCEWGNRQT